MSTLSLQIQPAGGEYKYKHRATIVSRLALRRNFKHFLATYTDNAYNHSKDLSAPGIALVTPSAGSVDEVMCSLYSYLSRH